MTTFFNFFYTYTCAHLFDRMTAGHQDIVNMASKPLEHGQLQEEKELFAYDSLQDANDIKEPSVLFTGDYSCLKKGPVVSALEHWGKDQRNVCIITGR